MLKTKLFCSGLSFLVYYNTLDSLFVYDDSRAILQNRDVLSSSPWSNLLYNDFWGTPLSHNGSHKSYRPLCTLTFKLNHLVSGFQPFGFHLVNVILHTIATYLFTCLAESAIRAKLGVLLAGCLFALHPVHSEAVAGVVGRADLLAGVFFLLSLLSYNKHGTMRDKKRKHDTTSSSAACSGSESDEVTRGKVPQWDRNGNMIVSKHFLKEGTHFPKNKRTHENSPTYLLLSILFAACAMFSKEQGITVIGVCLVSELVRIIKSIPSIGGKSKEDQKKWMTRVKSCSTLIVSAICLLYLRAKVMGFISPTFAKSDNPAAASTSFLTRALTFLYLPVFNFWLLLCPTKLSFDWSMNAIELVERISDIRNMATLLFYSSLAAVAIRTAKQILQRSVKNERTDLIILSLSILILSFLPATNLFFYVGFVVAERVLYIPSMGFCLLLGAAVAQLIDSCQRQARRRGNLLKITLLVGLTSLVLVSHGLRTALRNKDWRTEEDLYRSGLSINPAKAFGNLGNVLTQTGRHTEAEKSFRKALEVRPNMGDVHYNLGVLLQQQGRLGEAVTCYTSAIHYRPKLVLAHLNLALTYSSLNQKDKALKILLRIPKISDDGTKDPLSHVTTQVSALFNAGRIYLEQGRARDALQVLEAAEEQGRKIHYSGQQAIMNLLGEAYQAANNTKEAERWYRAALAEKPDHVPAYLMYGKMLAKNKTRLAEAEIYFRRANEIAPNDSSVHSHYGFFLLDLDRTLEAANQFERATQISPNDYESNFNAGVAYRLAGQNEMAEKFYRRAVMIKPEDPSSHMNLGAMLHLVGKLTEAEIHYLQAWKLNPGDSATKTNIERLHNIMRKQGMKVRPLSDNGN